MYYGVRGHDLGRCRPEQLGDMLKKAGYNCVQLVFHKVIEGVDSYDSLIGERITSAIRASCARTGVKVALTGCYQDLGNPAAEAYNRKIYPRYMRLAQAAGARYVGTETAVKPLDADTRAAWWPQTEKMVKEICAQMHKRHMSLLLESVGYYPLCTPQQCLQLLAQVPQGSLKFIFDAANIVRDEQVQEQKALWEQWFANPVLTSHIAVIHFKDFKFGEDGKRQGCKLGEGVIDFDFLKDKFRALPHLEYCIREEQQPEFVAADLAFMKHIIEG